MHSYSCSFGHKPNLLLIPVYYYVMCKVNALRLCLSRRQFGNKVMCICVCIWAVVVYNSPAVC